MLAGDSCGVMERSLRRGVQPLSAAASTPGAPCWGLSSQDLRLMPAETGLPGQQAVSHTPLTPLGRESGDGVMAERRLGPRSPGGGSP